MAMTYTGAPWLPSGRRTHGGASVGVKCGSSLVKFDGFGVNQQSRNYRHVTQGEYEHILSYCWHVSTLAQEVDCITNCFYPNATERGKFTLPN